MWFIKCAENDMATDAEDVGMSLSEQSAKRRCIQRFSMSPAPLQHDGDVVTRYAHVGIQIPSSISIHACTM
jgi:hypothetical protein